MGTQRYLQHEFEGSPRLPARFLGDYELIAELARGGMGRVFLARRQGEAGFERLYAIKVMHDHLADEPDAVIMLIDEAKIASKLHHPNVVPIVDIGNQDGNYFLVMDYVEGCSLSELFRKTKEQRPARRIVTLILDALRGLHAAHELTNDAGESLDLIHRDFSPQNLLVSIDGSCRVTDFGIAKASARLTHTRSTVQKGKISYMCPEQLTEELELDRRADLWAAGVVLWQALTGEHPFKSSSEAATIHAILERQVLPPSTVGLRPPKCFDKLCLKALSRNRESRFDTAQDMADELQRMAVRYDHLAPRSEVATWVGSSFEKKIKERKQLIRTIKEKGADVAWLEAPMLPRLALTPTTGRRRRGAADVERFLPDMSPPPQAPSEEDAQKHGDERRQTARRPKKRPKRAARRNIKTLLGVAVGSLVGFTICMVVFMSLRTALVDDDAPDHQDMQAQAEAQPLNQPRPVAIPTEPAQVEPSSHTESEGAEQSSPPTAEQAQPSSGARITFTNVPDGAVIRLDGRVVQGTELTVPIDGRERVVRVDHPDFLQWRRSFIATEDSFFQVRLRPRRHRVTSPSRPTKTPHSKIIRDPGF